MRSVRGRHRDDSRDTSKRSRSRCSESNASRPLGQRHRRSDSRDGSLSCDRSSPEQNARGKRQGESRETVGRSGLRREQSAPKRSNRRRGKSDSRDGGSPRSRSFGNRVESSSPQRSERHRQRNSSKDRGSADAGVKPVSSAPKHRDVAAVPKQQEPQIAVDPRVSMDGCAVPLQQESQEAVDPRVNMDGCAEDMQFVEEIDISELPDGTLLDDFVMLNDGTLLADANLYDPEEAAPQLMNNYWKTNEEQAPEVRVSEEGLALALTELPETDDPQSHGTCTVGKWQTVALKSIKDHDERLPAQTSEVEQAKKSQASKDEDQWKSLVRWNSRSRSREDDDKEKSKLSTSEKEKHPAEREKEKREGSQRLREQDESKPKYSGERQRSRSRRRRRSPSERRRRRSGSRHKRIKRTNFNFGEQGNAEAAEQQISAKLSGFGRQVTASDQLQPLADSSSGFGRTEIQLTQIQIRCLLGKGGACVQGIKRQTGAQIVVRTPPGCHLGIVTISGNHKPALKAIEQVLLEKGCPIHTTSDDISLAPGVIEVPERLVGQLVGKTSFFATVQAQYGSDIMIQQLPQMSPTGDRYMQIAGGNWMPAKEMISTWISEAKTRSQSDRFNKGWVLTTPVAPGMTPTGIAPGMTPGTPASSSGFMTPMPSISGAALPGKIASASGCSL